MSETNPLRGLTTISFWAQDVSAAADWYSQLLGVEPYYVMPDPPAPPRYMEFRIGDYQHELGIIDASFAPPRSSDDPGGAIAYWHVDDPQQAYEDLLARGATPFEEPTPRGEGYVTAAVVDPFGNVLGVMSNPHYLEVLERRSE
ncbi:VOC family protein [Cellulomonas timonensis]|uniref:VOC family protein n=1 Tax=Cellulomonas timonensis TaxID=1689271 RepID=UPI000829C9CA|nr:VOC family protein [Cellulomonas timonensis]